MFVVIVGGGKVGASLAEILKGMGYEFSIVESKRHQFEHLQMDFGPLAFYGDGTELYILEKAGVPRADMVIAVTGDDEDNIVVGQVAREKWGVRKIIARVNNPGNQEIFDMLGIQQTVSATSSIVSLIEHEVPEHESICLLDLKNEGLAILDVEMSEKSAMLGQQASTVEMPKGSRIIAVLSDTGCYLMGKDEGMEPTLEAGDRVLVILASDAREAVHKAFLG